MLELCVADAVTGAVAAACAGLATDSLVQTCLTARLQQPWIGTRAEHQYRIALGELCAVPFPAVACGEIVTAVTFWSLLLLFMPGHDCSYLSATSPSQGRSVDKKKRRNRAQHPEQLGGREASNVKIHK